LHILDDYKKDFSQEEISKLVINGGYMVYNLNKMRKDHLEASFLKCYEMNYWRILQLEQDVINLCCYPKIKFLPLKNMMCNYVYDLYNTDEDFNSDKTFSRLELKEAMENPVLLHYPGYRKPWRDRNSTKADEWFKYVIRTPFCEEFRLRSPTHKDVIGSRRAESLSVSNASTEMLSVSNASTEMNVFSMPSDARAAGKGVNILAKILRWIHAPSSGAKGR